MSDQNPKSEEEGDRDGDSVGVRGMSKWSVAAAEGIGKEAKKEWSEAGNARARGLAFQS
jgi:hypothetical protein